MFCNHNKIKLDVDSRKVLGNSPNICKLKQYISNIWTWVKEKKINRKYFKLNKMKNTAYQKCRLQLEQCLEEKLSLKICVQKKETPKTNDLSFHIKKVKQLE